MRPRYPRRSAFDACGLHSDRMNFGSTIRSSGHPRGGSPGNSTAPSSPSRSREGRCIACCPLVGEVEPLALKRLTRLCRAIQRVEGKAFHLCVLSAALHRTLEEGAFSVKHIITI